MEYGINMELLKPILQPTDGFEKRGIQYEKAAEAVGKLNSMAILKRGEEAHLGRKKRI